MAKNEIKINKSGRILYVEPNDVFDSVDGIPMTPDYSDYCISFNLVVEVPSRFKSESGTDKKNKYVISWISSDNNIGMNHVSFLQGEEADKFDFLTTYYTDIDFNDIKRRNIVEGLGIENITVSFDSYYVPTVSIKFIDVRGSSLFAREEAIHENNGLNADNVFGCFFTIPYPLFRLQIKGFYGKPVTYQLTCSGFKGSFNSQTGNFEAIATFIGYSYSLLTDIPLVYLAAAPYSKYYGEEYWNSKVKDSDWKLANDVEPVKLFYLINKINASILNLNEDELITENEINEKNNARNEKEKLNKIIESYYSFVEALKHTAISSIEDKVKYEKLFLLYKENNSDNPITYGEEVQKSHKELLENIENYNRSYPNNSIERNFYPDETNIEYRSDLQISCKKFCNIQIKDELITNVDVIGADIVTIETLKEILFNSNRTINNEVSKVLFDWINNKNNTLNEYGYVVDLHGLLLKLRERIKSLLEKSKEIDENIRRRKLEKQKEVIEIVPYIGNIVKIVMCHLETFTHMMYKCYYNIKNSDRSPSNLGIKKDLSNTDIVGEISQVPPWPMCYNNGADAENNNSDNNENIIAWVGDFSHNFEEEKLINNLQLAVQKIEDLNEEPITKKNKINLIVSTIDSANNSNPFDKIYDTSISSISANIGIRAANLFGVLSNNKLPNDVAKNMGIMDAINLYQHIGSASLINSELFSRVSNGGLQNAIYDINLCDANADNYGITYKATGKVRHIFETVVSIIDKYNNNDRHPIFINDNGIKYVHYYNDKFVGLVPVSIKDFKDYSNDFKYYTRNKCFSAKIDGENLKFISNASYKSNTKEAINIASEDLKKYFNESIFNVITKKDEVDRIINNYEYIKNGSIEIDNYSSDEDLSNVIEYFWSINDSYANVFSKSNTTLYRDILTIENGSKKYFTKLEFLPNNSSGVSPVYIGDEIFNRLNTDNVTYDSKENNWSYNGNIQNIDNLHIYSNQIITDSEYDNKGHINPIYSSLFGSQFYYMQNNKIIKENYNEDTNGRYEYRRNRNKCFLFLHTLEYNIDYKPNFLDKNKINGKIECLPYGYILLLGAYLWRNRFLNEYGFDPIIYEEGNIKYHSATYKDSRGYTIDMTFYQTYYFKSRHLICMKNKTNNDSNEYHKYVSELFYNFDDKKFFQPDYPITNKLINLFEEFVNSDDWSTIINNLELKKYNGIKSLDDYVGKTFSDDIKKFDENIKFYKKNTNVEEFDERITENITDEVNKKHETLKFISNTLIIALENEIFHGILGNYIMAYSNTNNLQLVMSNYNKAQDVIKNLYTKRVIVADGSAYCNTQNSSVNKNNEILLSESNYSNYLNGFVNKLQDICDFNNRGYLTTNQSNVEIKRAPLISMYMYLKNLWDKWLINNSEEDFTVKNYFGNFVFIDSFYRNIFKEVLINYNILLKTFETRLKRDNFNESSLYSFLGDLASETHCLFLSMPDYVCLGDEDDNEAVDNMKSIFKPIPYNHQNGIERNNKFIFIYTHKPSENASEQNNYKGDSFDIWTNGHITEKANELFRESSINNSTDQINRYGYNVPSFGVAFSRQNNHLFKNIKLDMNNPMETEQSIKTLNNIAKLGATNVNKAMFIGQDIYPIFSNYSYTCEVEMMGDAQIMPLMYFQLMNVPMWRGTYMIYNVNHVLTPGNMVTTFKGMKMSSNCVPYTRDWFLTSNDDTMSQYIPTSTSSDNNGEILSHEDTDLQSNYYKSETNIDYWNKKENRAVIYGIRTDVMDNNGRNIYVNEKLKKLYNELYDEIENLPENKNNTNKWNVCLSHVLRKGTSNSDHCFGLAMDLKVMHMNGETGKWSYKLSGQYQKELLKVFDILYCNHRNVIRQCILEYKKKEDMKSDTLYNFNVLHVAVNDESIKSLKTEFFIAYNTGKNFGNINKNEKNREWFLNNVPNDFRLTAKRAYRKEGFYNMFINYIFYKNDDRILDEHFNYSEPNNDGNTTLSYRLNNPGSLRETGIEWLGKDGSENGFVRFTEMKYGIRALMINVNTIVKRGIEINVNGNKKIIPVVLISLINKWAPSSDNNKPREYTSFITKMTGIKPGDAVPLLRDNKNFYKNLSIAIAKQEGGISLSEDDLEWAYNSAKEHVQK